MAIKSVARLSRRARLKQDMVVELVRGKTVIHYGCVDDDEALIKRKAGQGYYLHQLVTNQAKTTVGIDLNKEAFGFLEDNLGVDNVVYGDVEDPATFELDKKILKKADVVLIPDLIEHLNNPGNMLRGIRQYFSKDVKVIILTPNPTAWYYFMLAVLNKEIYSPYHTMSFTTENMTVLLRHYGFKIDRVSPGVLPKERSWPIQLIDKLVGRAAVFISPGLADFYLYECSRDDNLVQ